MSGPGSDGPVDPSPASRRAGYVVAAAVNLLLLWIVNNLLDWGWPSFLTADFDRVVPAINASLVATVAANLLWMVRDPAWLKHLSQIGLNLISLIATIRTWQIFPFDFSDHDVDWVPVLRALIVISIIGLTIGTIVEAVKLSRAVGRPSTIDP